MPQTKLKGTLKVPGDKSISHRALIFSLLALGRSSVSNLSPAADCQSTIACLRNLGVEIQANDKSTYSVDSPGLSKLEKPGTILDAGNSGTTIRLLSGLLAGQPFESSLTGDTSLQKRPMSRVLNHLAEMGAGISYLTEKNYPPFSISGGTLNGRHFNLNVASAQVQTALMLAGLQADSNTSITLPAPVRDHTERMLTHAQIPFQLSPDKLTLSVSKLSKPVAPFHINVAGDISSAAFFMVAAACLPGSQLHLPQIGLNPGRTLVLDALVEMGAEISVTDKRMESGEPIGTISVQGGKKLNGITIGGDRIAAGIDEIPILALAGAVCQGTFSIRDAAELRVKESDRLNAIVQNLRSAGANVTKELDDGFDIQGVDKLNGGCPWITHGDHRLAMMGAIANLICSQAVAIDDTACTAVSYPQFQQDLESLLL